MVGGASRKSVSAPSATTRLSSHALGPDVDASRGKPVKCPSSSRGSPSHAHGHRGAGPCVGRWPGGGGVVLVGGDPGIGKSTLLLQALAGLAAAATARCT